MIKISLLLLGYGVLLFSCQCPNCEDYKASNSVGDNLIEADAVARELAFSEDYRAGRMVDFQFKNCDGDIVENFPWKEDTFFVYPSYKTEVANLKGKYSVELVHERGNYSIVSHSDGGFRFILNEGVDTVEYYIYLSSIDDDYLFKEVSSEKMILYKRIMLGLQTRILDSSRKNKKEKP